MSTRDVQSHADRFAHALSKGDFAAAESHLDAIEAWVSSRRREVVAKKPCPAPAHAPDCGIAHGLEMSCCEVRAAALAGLREVHKRLDDAILKGSPFFQTQWAQQNKTPVAPEATCSYPGCLMPAGPGPLTPLTSAPHIVPQDFRLQKKKAAPCLHSVYGKGTCLLPYGHQTDHDFGVSAEGCPSCEWAQMGRPDLAVRTPHAVGCGK